MSFNELNKALDDSYNQLTKRWREEKKFHDKIEREAKQGKRKYVIIKDGYGCLVSYPESHKMVDFLTHNQPEKYAKQGRLIVLSLSETKKVLAVAEEVTRANRKYNNLLERLFMVR